MEPAEPLPYDERQWRRVVFAEEQPEYNPLVALMDAHGNVRTRWKLTPNERRAILDGACITLDVMTFGHPIQPVLLAVEGTDSLIELARQVEAPNA